MKVIMFGAPGAGKGTISKELEKVLDIPHVSTGDMLRQAVKDETELGLMVKDLMGTGDLIPDEIMDGVVEEQLSKMPSYFLDGYPRTLPQAKCYLGFDKPDAVVVLRVKDDVILERLLRRAKIEGREDDTEEVIRKRLGIYREETSPILTYFESEQINVREVDGDNTIDGTTDKVLSALREKMEI